MGTKGCSAYFFRSRGQGDRSLILKGYSLIEMLTVFTVVSILAGLLTTSLQTVREKGLQSKCLQHEKELTAAVIQFTLDNEHFPHELAFISPYILLEDSPASTSSGLVWAHDDLIRKYYEQQFEITRCPKVNGFMTDPKPVYSYGINEFIMDKNMSEIDEPSTTIVLVDSDREKVVRIPQHVAYRHFSGANTAYADGHVQWEKSFIYIDYDKGHGNDPGGIDPDNPALIKGKGAKAG